MKAFTQDTDNSIVDFDEYGEVINGPRTFFTLGTCLTDRRSIIIGWNDEEGTHFDILFTIPSMQMGLLQGGISLDRNLFVSIIRKGSTFAFNIDNYKNLHPNYVAEKLQIDNDITTEKLTELIKGICANLIEIMGEKKYRD